MKRKPQRKTPRTNHRVVVTGMGLISPLGKDLNSFWSSASMGRSGIKKIERFDPGAYKSQIAGLVEDFDPRDHLTKKETLRLDTYVHYGVAAADQALAQSGLGKETRWRSGAGAIIGTGFGGIESLCNQMQVLHNSKPRYVDPFLIPMMLTNSASAYLAIRHNLQGMANGVSSACASGLSAIAYGCRLITSGSAKVILAGGCEAPIVPIVHAGFDSLNALATQWNDYPENASRPFDAQRNGFVISEGAAIIVLEELSHALERNASIFTEVAGWSETCDAFHIVSPRRNGEGMAAAMQGALTQGRCSGDEIDLIQVHATSTKIGDRQEAEALSTVFGSPQRIPAACAIKALVGHTLAASGPLALIAAILSMVHATIPPNMNLTTPDELCKVPCVCSHPQRKEIRSALINSSGFGGHNVSVLIRSFEESSARQKNHP